MVRKCEVPNCNERKLSLFLVPKNAEERQKWCDILKCTFREKAYVCERHFPPSSIKSSFSSQTENGVVIYTRQFERKRLRKGVLPNKLDNENDVPIYYTAGEIGEHGVVVPVKIELGDVKIEDECPDTEFVPAQFDQSISDGELHTTVLQNIPKHEAGDELPLILNDFMQNNSDKNLEPTVKKEVIYTYSKNNMKYELHGDHEIIDQEEGIKNEFKDDSMGYTYEESVDCPLEEVMVKEEHDDGGELVECDMCQKVFTTAAGLKRHVTADHGNSYLKDDPLRIQVYPCCGEPSDSRHTVCKRLFTHKDSLAEHLQSGTGEKTFPSDLCPKEIPSSGALKKDRRKHIRTKTYRCDQCDEQFTAKRALKRHLRTHSTEEPHAWPYCEKSFGKREELRAHRFHYTSKYGHTCPSCGRGFDHKYLLNAHIKFKHEGVEPLSCTQCDKKCFTKRAINQHMMSHSGQKPFTCRVCRKAFTTKAVLKAHLLTHVKEPPCSCDMCGRAFIRQDLLMRHIRSKHLDVLPSSTEKKRLQQHLLSAAADAVTSKVVPNIVWNNLTLTESIKELLTLLVDEVCLNEFGFPEASVDEVLDSVIKRCGHKPQGDLDYSVRMRENAKLLLTVVLDDGTVKELLNNQTVDEVILHVLQLANKPDS